MEVLNTIQGAPVTEISPIGWVAFLALAVAIVLAAIAVAVEDGGLFGIAVIIGIVAIVTAAVGDTERPTAELGPTRYEVRLTPGTVIDAQKYTVVETRGSIVVIEEIRSAERK